MKRRVILTTPIPTWTEMADFYGLSKTDRKFVDGLFVARSAKTGTFVAKKSLSSQTRLKIGTKAASVAGKTYTRARKTA